MKKGIKLKEKNRTKGEAMRDQYTVVLERVETKVDLLAEGQVGLREELHGFKNEMYGFRDDVKSSFKSVMEHLYGIENELKDLKTRVENLEKNKENPPVIKEILKRLAKAEKEVNWLKSRIAAK